MMRALWRSYRLLFRWQFLRFRTFLPLLVIIQISLGIGVVYGLALLVPHIDHDSALYLTTGAPTLALILLGMNIVPGEVSQGRLTGRYDYIVSLPVPRLAPVAAEVTFWLAIQLPGTVLALVVAALRFHISLHIGWMVLPAVGLVALTSASVGYGLAVLVKPQIVNQVTAFMALMILLFSPINFPAGRMPTVLRFAHRVLPIQYMADVVRGSLTGRYADSKALAFGVVGGWCAASLAVSYRAATRRP
jgi:ABC-2 type transport system permease protein